MSFPRAVREPRKVDLISVHDYPADRYSAYWEIRVLPSDEGYGWGVRLYDRATNNVIEDVMDAAETRDEADTAAQQWVLAEMPKYKT